MLYEDRAAVATPEGVTLEFSLAGVGSRFIAAFLDFLLQMAALTFIWFLAAGLGEVAAEEWGMAFGIVATFIVMFGYDIMFETFSSGRTLGKRWTGLRVVREGGGPVTFRASAVRNLLRLVDFLPLLYLLGMTAVLVSSKNQRLGDLAAGTLVVREKMDAAVPGLGVGAAYAPTGPTAPWIGWEPPVDPVVAEAVTMWDVSGVAAEEVAMVRQFLARRYTLDPVARQRLALDLANRLRPKVVAPDERMGPEGFLERLVAAKTGRE